MMSVLGSSFACFNTSVKNMKIASVAGVSSLSRNLAARRVNSLADWMIDVLIFWWHKACAILYRYAALSMSGIHSNIVQLIVDLRSDTRYGFND